MGNTNDLDWFLSDDFLLGKYHGMKIIIMATTVWDNMFGTHFFQSIEKSVTKSMFVAEKMLVVGSVPGWRQLKYFWNFHPENWGR